MKKTIQTEAIRKTIAFDEEKKEIEDYIYKRHDELRGQYPSFPKSVIYRAIAEEIAGKYPSRSRCSEQSIRNYFFKKGKKNNGRVDKDTQEDS